MFWGLELEPAKKYTSTVEKNFHISMACLQPRQCSDDGYVSFMFCQDNKNFILCNLHKDKAVQVQLDLNFQKGDNITFKTMGAKHNVYLSGYLLDEDDDLDDLNDLELDSEEEMTDQDQTPIEVKRKKKQLEPSQAKKVPRMELEEDDDDSDEDDDENGELGFENNEDSEEGEEEDDSDDDDQEEDEDDDTDSDEEDEPVSPQKPKGQPQMQKQKKGTPQNTPVAQTNGKTPKSDKKKQEQGKSPATPATMKRVLEGGVIIEDTKVGQGTPAKPGKMVTVYYVGRLKQNNKQFDAATQGSGFKFRLGKGEVIKGWDIGVNGMKIGGKRKITIPAPLAYGNKGSLPQIPPNAPLVFDVELKGVS